MPKIKRKTPNLIARQAASSPSLADLAVPLSPPTAVTAEDRAIYRRAYIQSSRKAGKNAEVSFRLLPTDESGNVLLQLPKAGERTNTGMTWKPLSERNVMRNGDAILKSSSNKSIRSKIEIESDVINSYWGIHGILPPEYDLLEPYTLIDVESYLKQSITRKHSLAFRNGIEWTGENSSFVKYVKDRTNQIGFVMEVTFENLLKDILWNLWVCSNCIVAKIRDEDRSGGVANKKNSNRTPVAGYAIIPPHTIFPFLDGKGRIEKWRRFFKDGRPYKDYPVEDIIHFYWDRKPGHIFGTPRTVAVRDDILALRRLEENIELLLVHHLFPLFHVKVGTPEAPCEYYPDGSSEIDVIKMAIMNMPKEGVFVSDERVEVEVHGAESQGVNPEPMIEHLKGRVFVGCGVSPLDMGEAGANRATADNVSQNLKDAIKSDLRWFSGQVKMGMVKEWMQESRTNLSVQNATSDVNLEFHEIDTDSQIKMENHAMNAFMSHGIDQDELRKRFKMNPLSKEQEAKTHFQRHMVGLEKVKHGHNKQLAEQAHGHAMEQQSKANEAQVQIASSTKTTTTKRANSKTGSSQTKTVTEPIKKAAQNKSTPANQHGSNLDPHKARSEADPDLSRAVYDALIVVHKELSDQGLLLDLWAERSGSILETIFEGCEDRSFVDRLKQRVAMTDDPDMIFSMLRAVLAPPADSIEEEEKEDELFPQD